MNTYNKLIVNANNRKCAAVLATSYMFFFTCVVIVVFVTNEKKKKKKKKKLGKTSLVQHVIDTGDALPIKQRPYRTSPKCKQEIDRQVEDMLQKGIIRESVSPWSSPVVLVKKKDSSFRFCVDLRKVKQLGGKTVFLCLKCLTLLIL